MKKHHLSRPSKTVTPVLACCDLTEKNHAMIEIPVSSAYGRAQWRSHFISVAFSRGHTNSHKYYSQWQINCLEICLIVCGAVDVEFDPVTIRELPEWSQHWHGHLLSWGLHNH